MTTQIRALDGDVRPISDTDLDELRERLTGEVLRPGDDGFIEATTIWNGMIEKKPGLVARPRSSQDVARAVTFAADRELEISIKGGGHNIAGLALSDGGLTLDMSSMCDVKVEPEAAVASVGPGCRLGDVDRATQLHGLAATFGFVSQTGVAGLTLGGGFGYLTRQFGWTVDGLRSAEVVLSDGSIVHASREENDDLFWALRGGGGNFGVVTNFEFDLNRVGPLITGGLIAWSADEAEAVTDRFKEMTESAPRALTMAMLMRNAPAAPWLPEDKHGLPIVAVVVCHTGTADDAERDVAPLRAVGKPWADLIQRKEYVAQQSMLDATAPDGMHYYWKSEFVSRLTDELLSDYRQAFVGMNAPANQAVLFHLGGALGELSEEDVAMGNRDAEHACVIQSMYPAGGPAEENREWVRSTWTAMKQYSTGGNYINFQSTDEGGERIAESYRGNLDRLAEIKAVYDPGNLFRVNRNIEPT